MLDVRMLMVVDFGLGRRPPRMQPACMQRLFGDPMAKKWREEYLAKKSSTWQDTVFHVAGG